MKLWLYQIETTELETTSYGELHNQPDGLPSFFKWLVYVLSQIICEWRKTLASNLEKYY